MYCIAYGYCVESIHGVVCRIKTIQANQSRVSHLGRALGDGPLRNAKGLLFQPVKITVIDVHRRLRPALGEEL